MCFGVGEAPEAGPAANGLGATAQARRNLRRVLAIRMHPPLRRSSGHPQATSAGANLDATRQVEPAP